jgi:hypothetical protein
MTGGLTSATGLASVTEQAAGAMTTAGDVKPKGWDSPTAFLAEIE